MFDRLHRHYRGQPPASEDIDECVTGSHGCEGNCSNTEGSYLCTCADSLLLQSDGVSYRGKILICHFFHFLSASTFLLQQQQLLMLQLQLLMLQLQLLMLQLQLLMLRLLLLMLLLVASTDTTTTTITTTTTTDYYYYY